jgi:sensor histidine kinase YesM
MNPLKSSKKIGGRIIKSRIAIHVYWWLLTYFLFFYLIGPMEPENIRWNVYLYFFYLPLPVDLHFFILDAFFKKKKFFFYGFFLLVIIVIISILTNLYNVKFLNSPDPILKNIIEVISILIISTSMKIVKDGFKQKIQLQEIKSRQLQTELQLLKSQVNPHFLFNTLNNIYSLSLDNAVNLPAVIKKLSDLMSYLFESSISQEVPLRKEIDFIENYLTLKKLRLPSGSDIRFTVEGNPDKRMIPPMIFIPIVENCFKHGAKTTTGHFFVHIQLIINKSKLIFLTENNTRQKLANIRPGTGLKNVKRRLELLYPKSHNLNIGRRNSSFQVSLEIGP